jgi:hypothetical protein
MMLETIERQKFDDSMTERRLKVGIVKLLLPVNLRLAWSQI